MFTQTQKAMGDRFIAMRKEIFFKQWLWPKDNKQNRVTQILIKHFSKTTIKTTLDGPVYMGKIKDGNSWQINFFVYAHYPLILS